MQKGLSFPLRRLRGFARNDGYGLELVILVLEIQVSLAVLDALNTALQLVQELRVDVLEVVLDALPAFGGDFGGGVVDQVLAQSEDGIRRAVALDEARHTEFHEVFARATQTVTGRAEARNEVVVEELVEIADSTKLKARLVINRPFDRLRDLDFRNKGLSRPS